MTVGPRADAEALGTAVCNGGRAVRTGDGAPVPSRGGASTVSGDACTGWP